MNSGRNRLVTGHLLLFFSVTLVTGPRRSLSLKLSDTNVYEPHIQALLGTTLHCCQVVVLKWGMSAVGRALFHGVACPHQPHRGTFFFFFTLVTVPRRSLSLKLSDTNVYEPQIRARLGTTAHFYQTYICHIRSTAVCYPKRQTPNPTSQPLHPVVESASSRYQTPNPNRQASRQTPNPKRQALNPVVEPPDLAPCRR